LSPEVYKEVEEVTWGEVASDDFEGGRGLVFKKKNH
jgi:hypothetical protein